MYFTSKKIKSEPIKNRLSVSIFHIIEKKINNLTFFKCGTKINDKFYRIQYNFIENQLWINTWNEDGEYYFEDIKILPDLLKRFIKSFLRYLRKTTEYNLIN